MSFSSPNIFVFYGIVDLNSINNFIMFSFLLNWWEIHVKTGKAIQLSAIAVLLPANFLPMPLLCLEYSVDEGYAPKLSNKHDAHPHFQASWFVFSLQDLASGGAPY